MLKNQYFVPWSYSTLNRTQVSSKNATLVLSEVSPSRGHNVSTLNINQSSIQWAQVKNKTTRSNSLQFEVIALEQVALLSRNGTKVSFFLQVSTALHRELIIWDAFKTTSFGTSTGLEILIIQEVLRQLVGNSFNMTGLIRPVFQSLWPQVFVVS